MAGARVVQVDGASPTALDLLQHAGRTFRGTGDGAASAARRLYESLGGRPAEQGPTVSYWFGLPLP
jgi:hypothetical protein